MDRYKFRGKRESGDWVYGYYVVRLKGNSKEHLIYHTGPSNTNHISRVQADTVGQYTGLKDKNGGEGYAGNYIHARHKTTKEEIVDRIVWHDTSFSWGVQMDGWIMSLETLVNCYNFTIHDKE